jgi:hypothetical protein
MGLKWRPRKATTIKGVNGNIRRFNVAMNKATARGLGDHAKVVRNQARRITPVLTGALRRSGAFSFEIDSQGPVSAVAFGRDSVLGRNGVPTSAYAGTQHETPPNVPKFIVFGVLRSVSGFKHRAPGQWKFLQTADSLLRGQMMRRILDRVKF